MNSSDYLRQASKMLRRGADALKMEISQVQGYIDQLDKDVKDQIQSMKGEEAQLVINAAQTDDNHEEADNLRQVQIIRRDESEKQAEADQQKRELDAKIKQMQQDMNEYIAMSKDLASRAG